MIAKRNILVCLACFLLFVLVQACSKIDVPEEENSEEPEPPKPFIDKYENGFFLVNAGTTETPSAIHFVRYGTDSLFENIYQKETGKNIDSLSSKLLNAVLDKDKIYLLTQGQGRVVRLRSKNFTEESSSQFYTGRQWQSLAFISNDLGLLAGNDGLYQFSFTDMMATNRLDSFVNKPVRDIFRSGSYIFVLTDNAAKIIRAADFAVVKSIDSIAVGFAETADSQVWGGFGKRLVAIDGKTFAVTYTQLNDSVAVNETYPSMLSASSKGNYVFFATGGRKQDKTLIYRYKPDSAASLSKPFITLPQDQALSGAGFRYDKHIDALIVVAQKKEDKSNFVYIHDGATGMLQRTLTYPGKYEAIVPVIR